MKSVLLPFVNVYKYLRLVNCNIELIQIYIFFIWKSREAELNFINYIKLGSINPFVRFLNPIRKNVSKTKIRLVNIALPASNSVFKAEYL